MAASLAGGQTAEGEARLTMVRLGLAIFFSMNVMVFTIVLWTQDVYAQELAQSPAAAQMLYQLFRYVCLIFALPVMILLGGPLLDSALANLRRQVVSTDVLLLLGVTASFVYSTISVVRGAGHVYFEVGCMVLVAVTLGRWLEATGKLRTTAALRSLEKLLPDQARRLYDGKETMVPIDQVAPGDHLRVLPGERIPVDGVILRNMAAIDEQAVTGESQAAIKEIGDSVYGGTLNLDGDLTIEAAQAVSSGTLRRMIDAVLTAAARRHRYSRLADTLSAWLLPTVIVVAGLTLAFHWQFAGLEPAMMSALAVVLIACPCALGLAMPMAIWAALGRASQEGILLRDGDVLVRLAQARTLLLDKTGTITTGHAEILAFCADPQTSREQVLAVANTLAGSSSHPLAKAVTEYTASPAETVEIIDPRTIPGRGTTGHALPHGQPVFLGSRRLMDESHLVAEGVLRDALDQAESAGQSLACVGWDGRVRGVFVAQERLRDQVAETLRWFRDDGFKVELATGDHHARGAAIARLLDVPVHSELLPEEKMLAVETAQAKSGPVMMVGDGLNDAPALAAADVGIALGCGADVSRSSAAVCLVSSDLARLPFLIELARQTVRTMRWNIFWAVVYNAAGMAMAAAGWLNPILAALAMTVSSLLVVSGSLRLAQFGVDDAFGSLNQSHARNDTPAEALP